MVQIKKQFVSQDVINKRSYGKGNPVTSVTVHQTGNPTKGANAQAHANLQSKLNPRQASWHIQVDDKQAIQSFPDNIRCWHASDGRGPGNTTSLAIEICINRDGDYKKAVENGAKVVSQKLKEHNLKITDVKKHFDWFNKFCPEQLMRGHQGITWADFLNMVQDKPAAKPVSKPASKPKSSLTVDGKWGKDTTRALQVYLGTPIDGIISKQSKNSVSQSLYGNTVQFGTGGSVVIKSLQKLIGAKVDGLLGPATVRALQKYLLTTVDGKLSRPSLVVKALQRSLNAGVL